MKRFVRIVCILLVISVLLAVPAYATEQSQRASSFFSSFKAYCYATSSNRLAVYFMVIAVGTMDEVGTSEIKIQESSDGTNWTTVKTFTKDVYSQMTDTNTGAHSATLYYPRNSSCYYRARVEFYARNSTGTGIYYYYTAKI